MSKVYYTVITKRSKPARVTEVIEYIDKNADLCKELINESYIITSANAADALILAYTRSKKNPIQIMGFAMLNHFPKSLYVDIICAKGVGKKLMEKIEEYARKNHKDAIRLSALPQVINFYRKLGFTHNKDCEKEPYRIRKMAEEVKDLRFKTEMDEDFIHESFKNDKFRRLLMLLLKQTKQTCIDNQNKIYASDTRKLSKKEKEIMTVEYCSSGGFTMSKCLL